MQTSMAKALAALSLVAASVAQSQPTFRSRADLVLADVVVARELKLETRYRFADRGERSERSARCIRQVAR